MNNVVTHKTEEERNYHMPLSTENALAYSPKAGATVDTIRWSGNALLHLQSTTTSLSICFFSNDNFIRVTVHSVCTLVKAFEKKPKSSLITGFADRVAI